MATVEPFRALRYAEHDALGRRCVVPSAVAELDRRALRQDPLNVGHLITAPDPWVALRKWLGDGVLVEDRAASYWLLEVEQEGGRAPARFLLAGLTPDETISELEEGLGRVAQPSVSPVPALAADDHGALRDLLGEASRARAADLETRMGSQLMRLWRVPSGPLARRLADHLEDVEVRPLAPVPDRETFLAAILPLSDPGLVLRPFHRGIRGVQTFHRDRFLAVVKDYARIYDLDAPLTTEDGLAAARERIAELATGGSHAVLLVLPQGDGKILRFRQRLELAQIKAAPKNPTLRSLDLALLNSLVFKAVLGISEPEAAAHPQIFAVPSMLQLVEQVREGTFQAGFALNPPPLWEIRAVMEAGTRLPPATVRLEPQPPAGLLFMG